MNILIPALAAILALGAGVQDANKAKGADADKAIIAKQLPSYPMLKCPVSGKDLGSMGDAINLVAEGRLIRICCKGCTKGVRKDPAAMIAKIDAAVIRAQGPSYPLKTCVLTGKEMANPTDVVVGTRLVRTCCGKCAKKVKSNPAKHMKLVDAALIKAQVASYPLAKCAVSGKALDSMGGPVDVLHGTTLVRLCCKGCIKKVRKDGAKIVATIKEASAKKGGGKSKLKGKAKKAGDHGDHEHGK